MEVCDREKLLGRMPESMCPTLLSLLWDRGFTIAERPRDPTDTVKPPAGRAYQWMHLEHDRVMFHRTGWAPVPHERHPGVFAPWGATGNIEWSGMGLFEKPKFEVDAELAANGAKAHQNVQDWKDKAAGDGFFGVAGAVEEGHGVTRVEVGTTKTFENATPIPRDMQPYIGQIFEERDRLGALFTNGDRNEDLRKVSDDLNAKLEESPDLPKWPLLHSLLLPLAIKNVRKSLPERPLAAQMKSMIHEGGDNDGAPSNINTD